MDELTGGRPGEIFRKGDIVYRPLQPWSATVHRVLNHWQAQGIYQVPKVIGVDENQEMLSYVRGQTYNYPLTGPIASVQALQTAATLLRKLHETSASFMAEHDVTSFTWMLPPRVPFEVICHGDFAPYNVALNGDNVVGVFDFDTAHPAPRSWDLAFAVYCWAPMKACDGERTLDLNEQLHRARLFCDGYGASNELRRQLPEVMIDRVTSLVDFMHQEADRGDEKFIRDLERGHHLGYQRDISFLDQYRETIRHSMTSQRSD
ncbi:phosphotransferase enzyme family protein [Reinekea blandensis]|uniref:Phosphotransferase family protein n=1 Tax=Reinekea blandensis MED297 TaxID=314283 RepID=A4BGW1_9GAMM|nr:phosphotransferase [Reinekea blandensis]EAR08607.1 phosphotransferase family protein [Reinekea sp. MED297] [Reinekea blandensis MED297]